MPSDDSINALLSGGARIIQSVQGNGGLVSHYVNGGALAPGRCRWIDCTSADSAATQAAAIETALG